MTGRDNKSRISRKSQVSREGPETCGRASKAVSTDPSGPGPDYVVKAMVNRWEWLVLPAPEQSLH